MAETSGPLATNSSNAAPQNGEVATQGNGENAENPEPPRRSYFEVAKGFIIRAVFMYMVASYFRGNSTTPAQPKSASSVDAPLERAYRPADNYYENSTTMALYVFLSENEFFKDFSNPNALIWKKEDLVYGDWTSGPNGDGSFTIETSFKASEKLKKNGSIYLHSFFIKTGDAYWKSEGDMKFNLPGVVRATKQLNKFKKLKFTRTQNLLTGETPMSAEEMEEAERTNQAIISHWHPNITLNLVTDQTKWVKNTVPSPFNEFIDFTPLGDYYFPVAFYNDFWNLNRDYQPINDTTTTLELRVTYKPMSLMWWQIYCSHSMRSRYTANIFQDEEADEDQDSLKEALLETSPYLIGGTVIISILHSVLELLAFKNDIQFWNNRKSLEGLSVRSVFFNVFQSLIVLLYVLDNDTNTLIRISCFIGLAIEIWKINKVVDISINREEKFLYIFPRLKLRDKSSYIESSTKEYDKLAFKYLSWALYPLLVGYAIYSLLYLHHKGWYSWLLNMIYSFLLTFGFIMMTPQLFINYKLKSVAHMPWRMMSYKFINTFIDDIFAFVIKMPTMYRLGCFRDDIVFCIFLYQRWIYKIDPKRINEFGYSGEMENPPVENSEGDAVKSLEDKKED